MRNSQNTYTKPPDGSHGPPQITKSLLMTNAVCNLALYNTVYRSDIAKPLTADEIVRIEDGKKVNLLARELRPGGVDASKGNTLFGQASVDYTKKIIESGAKIIYEAAFQSADKAYFFKADILDLDERRIIEVKSSGSVLDEHITECAFYTFVLASLNFRVDSYSIAYINTDYARLDRLDVNSLFILQDVTERMRPMLPFVEKHAVECLATLCRNEPPKRKVGEHCLKPCKCPFIDTCFDEFSHRDCVTNIVGMRLVKKFSLLREGARNIQQLPRDLNLTERQTRQVDAHVNETTYVSSSLM